MERMAAKILSSILRSISFVFITIWVAATIFLFLVLGMLLFGLVRDALLAVLNALVG